jgi:hypothetical protein
VSSFITACDVVGSFQKSGWLARCSSSAIRWLLFAMSKSLHELSDLGVEFSEERVEFFHDV